jgi:hypothetical protein
MSITGWRVHFTRRDLAWPREVSPFIREFNELFGDLDQRLDDLGVPGGQPFLISPTAEGSLWRCRVRLAAVEELAVCRWGGADARGVVLAASYGHDLAQNSSTGRPPYTAHVEEAVRLCRLFGWERGRDAECEDAGLGLVA